MEYAANRQQIFLLFAEAIETSAFTAETPIADVPGWNSLGWLSVISLLDERYAIQLTSSEIRSFKTVNDAATTICNKLAKP